MTMMSLVVRRSKFNLIRDHLYNITLCGKVNTDDSDNLRKVCSINAIKIDAETNKYPYYNNYNIIDSSMDLICV